MSAGLKGNLSRLKKFSAALRELPRVVATRVAEKSAAGITRAASVTFAAGQDPYGIGWAPGADGLPVDLDETGALKRQARYVSIGTKLRVALGVPYAKFQIGKRRVFPVQGAILPAAYSAVLSASAEAVIGKELAR